MKSRNPLIGVILMVVCGGALAHDDDHLKAKRLHEAGDIVAAEQILAKVKQSHSGRVIEVELHEVDGRYLYEIELVDGKGEVRVFYFDAKTGEQAKGSFKHH